MTKKNPTELELKEKEIAELKAKLNQLNEWKITAGTEALKNKITRAESEAYELRWGSWSRYCEGVLGYNQYQHIENSANAQWVLEDCDNTNLDPDGFCRICDRYHYKLSPRVTRTANVPVIEIKANEDKEGDPITGSRMLEQKVIGHKTVRTGEMLPFKSGGRRTDQGCMTFGDTGTSNQYGSEIMFVGTSQEWAPVEDESLLDD